MKTENCQGCKYLRLSRYQNGKYLACYQGTTKGKWIAQIEECPISGGGDIEEYKKDTESEKKDYV